MSISLSATIPGVNSGRGSKLFELSEAFNVETEFQSNPNSQPTVCLSRDELRSHADVQRQFLLFWRTRFVDANGNSPPLLSTREAEIYKLPKSDYLRLHQSISKALFPLFDSKDALAAAESDFQRDSKGKSELDKTQFYDALFEIAETSSLNSAEYVRYLQIIFHRITKIVPIFPPPAAAPTFQALAGVSPSSASTGSLKSRRAGSVFVPGTSGSGSGGKGKAVAAPRTSLSKAPAAGSSGAGVKTGLPTETIETTVRAYKDLSEIEQIPPEVLEQLSEEICGEQELQKNVFVPPSSLHSHARRVSQVLGLGDLKDKALGESKEAPGVFKKPSLFRQGTMPALTTSSYTKTIEANLQHKKTNDFGSFSASPAWSPKAAASPAAAQSPAKLASPAAAVIKASPASPRSSFAAPLSPASVSPPIVVSTPTPAPAPVVVAPVTPSAAAAVAPASSLPPSSPAAAAPTLSVPSPSASQGLSIVVPPASPSSGGAAPLSPQPPTTPNSSGIAPTPRKKTITITKRSSVIEGAASPSAAAATAVAAVSTTDQLIDLPSQSIETFVIHERLHKAAVEPQPQPVAAPSLAAPSAISPRPPSSGPPGGSVRRPSTVGLSPRSPLDLSMSSEDLSRSTGASPLTMYRIAEHGNTAEPEAPFVSSHATIVQNAVANALASVRKASIVAGSPMAPVGPISPRGSQPNAFTQFQARGSVTEEKNPDGSVRSSNVMASLFGVSAGGRPNSFSLSPGQALALNAEINNSSPRPGPPARAHRLSISQQVPASPLTPAPPGVASPIPDYGSVPAAAVAMPAASSPVAVAPPSLMRTRSRITFAEGARPIEPENADIVSLRMHKLRTMSEEESGNGVVLPPIDPHGAVTASAIATASPLQSLKLKHADSVALQEAVHSVRKNSLILASALAHIEAARESAANGNNNF